MYDLAWGVIGGVIGYGLTDALKKRGKSGEEDRSAGGDGRNTASRGWSAGPGFQTEVLARIETLERAFQEQNQEVTARFNRLAARSRRREPDGEPGPVDETAQGLTRKQELRAKVAAATRSTHSLLRGGESR